jgi:hypothetical protein
MLVVAACAVFLCFKQFKNNNWNRCISSDGKGYYAYLPAFFIYHDTQFDFVSSYENKYYNPENRVNFLNKVNDKVVNKYWLGVALLMSPFFLIAHTLAHIFVLPADGYSLVYQVMIAMGACFYLLLGMFFLRKLLLNRGHNELIVTITLLSIVFATNLFYYTVAEPSISHVYSFSIICSFAYTAQKLAAHTRAKYFFLLCALLGIIVLIRPPNIMIILSLPFIAGDYKNFKKVCAQIGAKGLTIGICLLMALISLQLIYYKLAAGQFVVYSYGKEHFNFMSPQLSNFLFSYRRGLFVYAPVLFFALFGIVVLAKRSFYQAGALVLFLVIIVYVMSSWWMWYYGGGFGMRPMIDYFVFFAILLALLLEREFENKFSGIVTVIILLIFTATSQIQTYQKVNFIMPWDGINKEIYWKIFLKTDKSYIGKYQPNTYAQ